jgi:hypothetical protein
MEEFLETAELFYKMYILQVLSKACQKKIIFQFFNFSPDCEQLGVLSVQIFELLQDVLELVALDDVGDRPIAVLLTSQKDKVRSHRHLLAVPDFFQTNGGCHVIVSCLVSDSPAHIDHLICFKKLKTFLNSINSQFKTNYSSKLV